MSGGGYGNGYGAGFALIVVLFSLLIIVGTTFIYKSCLNARKNVPKIFLGHVF